jgi:hypothetical protein
VAMDAEGGAIGRLDLFRDCRVVGESMANAKDHISMINNSSTHGSTTA